MGSLKRCIGKVGLNEHEAGIIKAKVNAYRRRGFSAQESSIKAVGDYVAELEAERADVVAQLGPAAAQETQPPAPETSTPAAEAIAEATPPVPDAQEKPTAQPPAAEAQQAELFAPMVEAAKAMTEAAKALTETVKSTQEASNAKQDTKTGAPDEDVRQQQGPEERQGEMPAAEGRRGVREGGQGEEAVAAEPGDVIGSSPVDQAAHEAATSTKNELPQPTEAQKDAGNYRKGHITISGLDIAIENPEGSKRRPEWPTLKSHYGYLNGTVGKDKDHLDVFVKPGTTEDYSGPVFVVDQVNKDGTFDEHKIMLGFETSTAAAEGYLENYTPDWNGLGAMKQFTMPEFKLWLKAGNTKNPVALKGKKLLPKEKPEALADASQTEHVRRGREWWDGLNEEQRLAAAVTAGWSTEKGTPNFVAKRLAKTEWDDITPMSRETLMRKNGIAKSQQTDIESRISAAEAGGVVLSDADKDEIRRQAAEVERVRREADRIARRGSDPMGKGNAFPMGVGYTKMTKRKEQAIDRSVRLAGEASKLYEKATNHEKTVDSMLSGKYTEADKSKKSQAKETGNRKVVETLVNWKPGTKFGNFEVVRVNNDRDGYPASFTISGEGIVKGVMDKVNVVKELFGGDVERFRNIVDDVRKNGIGEQAAPAKTEERAEMPPASRIEDFGETIEGARKHYAEDYKNRMRDALGVDIASEPLSKSWPEPDYQKLLDGGADQWAVAFVHSARDEIPPKPRQSWKVTGWVENVKTLRGFSQSILDGSITKERVNEELNKKEFARLRDALNGRIDLYQAIGHEHSLKGIRISAAEYSILGGQKIDPPRVIWAVEKKAGATSFSNWPTMMAHGDTREEAIANFKKAVADGVLDKKSSDRDVSFDIYSYRSGSKAGKYYIGKKIGKNYVDLESFDDAKAARSYLAENKEKLVEKLEKVKYIPDERRASNAPRVGVDHRNGANVTPEQFSETFGFRGVQFGNYVEGAKRQADLNEAYDALMDMAGVLGIPPKALSLNGELGLAFGARGKGAAGVGRNAKPPKAHYEYDHVVINLTKEKGAGSLAHEWWHALDNYFSRMRGDKTEYLTEKAYPRGEGVRPEIVAAFKKVIQTINETGLKERSNRLDKTRTKPYWETGREMSARAFESYIVEKLRDQGTSNDYLANIVSEDYWRAAAALGMEKEGTYPYPEAAEIPAVRAVYDNFFRTVETKETDRGTALFSAKSRPQGGISASGVSMRDLDATVARVTRGYTNLPAIVTLESPDQAPAELRQQIEEQGATDVEGAFYDGKVYLFAGNLRSEARAEHVLMEHELGHYGLRGVYGKELDPILNHIYLSNPKVARQAAELRKAHNLGSNAEAVEEVLVEMPSEELPRLRGWDRLVSFLRDWFAGHGFNRLADQLNAALVRKHGEQGAADLFAAEVITKAREWARSGRQTAATQLYMGVTKLSDVSGDRASVADRIAEVLEGKWSNVPIYLGETPKVLQRLGMKPNPVGIEEHVVDKAHFDHGLSQQEINALADAIADPVSVYDSDTVPGSMVVVTDMVRSDGRPIIVAIRPDVNVGHMMANMVSSAYPRNDHKAAFARWERDGLLRYVNQEKRPEWQRSGRGTIPQGAAKRSVQGKLILSERDVVKDDRKSVFGSSPWGRAKFSRRPDEASEVSASEETDSLPQGIVNAYRDRANKVIDRIDKALDPLGRLPESREYLARRYLALGIIAKADEIAKGIGRAFANTTEQDKQAVYDYFTTRDARPAGIRNELARNEAVKVKAMIESVGDAMVARGMLSEEAREAHRGSYLPQLYLKWLLDEADVRALGAGKKPSSMGYLKGRKIERTTGPDGRPQFVWKETGKPLTDAQVLDLGPISDPGFLSATAIATPVRDMALLDFLSMISKNEKWVLPNSIVQFDGQTVTPQWLKTEADRLRRQADHYDPDDATRTRALADRMDSAANKALGELAGDFKDYRQVPNTAKYGRLRGLWVRKEIYDDLVGVYDLNPTDPSFIQSLLGYGGIGTKVTQLWKMGKVALNPPSQVRNFVSNGVLLQLSGIPGHRIPGYLIRAAREIYNDGKFWKVAKKYGVTESTFSTQELYRIKRDLLDLEMREGRLNWLGKLHRIGAIVADTASDAYQFSEAMHKTAKIMHAMDNGMSEAEAAIEAQKWLFDYSLVPKGVRYARNAPIGVPFITFYYKALPRLAEVALLHPQRLIPWVALFQGLPLLWASMTGEDDDEYERLQKAMPDWLRERGHALILPYKDENGRWQVIDLGYFMPWSMFTEFAGDLSRGEIGEAIKTAGLFSGPVTNVIVAIQTGKDPFTGRDIVDPGDPPGRQFAAVANYAYDMMMPPIIGSRGLLSPMGLVDVEYGGKIVQAATGRTNKYGDPTATAGQTAIYPIGFNVYGLEPDHSAAQNVLRYKYEADKTELALQRRLHNRGLSDDERQEIVNEYSEELQRRYEKIREYTEGVR